MKILCEITIKLSKLDETEVNYKTHHNYKKRKGTRRKGTLMKVATDQSDSE